MTTKQRKTIMTQPTSSDLIRSAREAFNRAIAEKDAKAHPPVAGAELSSGYRSQRPIPRSRRGRNTLGELFQTDPTAVYRRTPREITTNEAWGIAEELGNWQGEYTNKRKFVNASGVYAAKWQRTQNRQWVLQAEVFTTINFDEACTPPDPI
jgi:hypothetical protein